MDDRTVNAEHQVAYYVQRVSRTRRETVQHSVEETWQRKKNEETHAEHCARRPVLLL